jgi:hypothetical protein
MPKEIATIGVYGTTESSFFRALQEFGTTHFVDIRRRRGMRGSKYAYANSSALQRSLTALDINYLHDVQLRLRMKLATSKKPLTNGKES